MIQELIERSKQQLDNFYTMLDANRIEEVVDLVLKCKGTVFLSGIGKSGYIAKKIAMTLVSTGTKSMFLDPLNLLHGDIGAVDASDVVIVMSKSGFTKELVDLIPFIKNTKACVIACVSQKDSPLEALCDKTVYLPIDSELDSNNLVPTLSTQVQLIFGDILTIALMQSKKIGLDLYATLHPAGSIGKKLMTKVDELMIDSEQVPYCSLEATVKEVLVELSSKKCGCVVVKDESNRLKGIFTDGDLRRSLEKIGTAALDKKVSDLMSVNPVYVSKNTLAHEAKKTMQKDDHTWINVLPVVEIEKVVGLLRLHDLLKAGI